MNDPTNQLNIYFDQLSKSVDRILEQSHFEQNIDLEPFQMIILALNKEIETIKDFQVISTTFDRYQTVLAKLMNNLKSEQTMLHQQVQNINNSTQNLKAYIVNQFSSSKDNERLT